MDNISTHNDNNLIKERAQQSKQSRVISTRNVVPYNRPVTKDDVAVFVEKRKAILVKNTDEEIKPAVAKLDDEGYVVGSSNFINKPGITFTDEQKEMVKELSETEQPKIDYAAEREKLVGANPEQPQELPKKTVVVKRKDNASV